jgi:hypothetical protein
MVVEIILLRSLAIVKHVHFTVEPLKTDQKGQNMYNHISTVKPVLNGISGAQNTFLLKPGFRLIKV